MLVQVDDISTTGVRLRTTSPVHLGMRGGMRLNLWGVVHASEIEACRVVNVDVADDAPTHVVGAVFVRAPAGSTGNGGIDANQGVAAARLRRGLRSPESDVAIPLIGMSAAAAELRREIDHAARAETKVLLTGESGVGKEVTARLLHRRGARASAPFTIINCAGVPEPLLESELFGHMKGSFTGAVRDKPGRLETADRGTAFLDEVAEMSPRMQSLLLRFVETGETQKLGSDNVGHRVDVRLIAATSRDLLAMVEAGTFRKDLYYRLNVIHLSVPPLRDRRDDVPAFVDHFRLHFAALHGVPKPAITTGAMRAFSTYAWPGNVRELQNVIERMVVMLRGATIDVEHLPPEFSESDPGVVRPLYERRRTTSDALYRRMLEERESFWTSVYPRFMAREITRANVQEVIRLGLEEARGNYKIVSRLFNMETRDYKRFLNFLRKHDCQIPFKEYR